MAAGWPFRIQERLVMAPPRSKRVALRTSQSTTSEKILLKKLDLDQYYTCPNVAQRLYNVFSKHFDPADYYMVEPSAGAGAFYRILPSGSLGLDIDPQYAGILKKNFLSYTIKSNRRVAIIGNPPFGQCARLAIRFFNHAAWQANVIAFILPRSFKKAGIENKLNSDFHLVWEELVEEYAFVHLGKRVHVPTVFQIWERRPIPRELRSIRVTHPDFSFSDTPYGANSVIQRVGARAGKIHHNFNVSPKSHYFICGDVEHIMSQIDLAAPAANVTGNPSLAKSEIVALYMKKLFELKAEAQLMQYS